MFLGLQTRLLADGLVGAESQGTWRFLEWQHLHFFPHAEKTIRRARAHTHIHTHKVHLACPPFTWKAEDCTISRLCWEIRRLKPSAPLWDASCETEMYKSQLCAFPIYNAVSGFGKRI